MQGVSNNAAGNVLELTTSTPGAVGLYKLYAVRSPVSPTNCSGADQSQSKLSSS